uniref:Uncharacterized protein n=1 Tax=Mycena chlorophos TaxID=658473 RepID=A0ABQ0LWL7_MYCCL|nr:predicted protein [Mycena chlorophos]
MATSTLPARRPLARSNSSLLGTIKNIVTAPLNWFSATDDFEESPDLKGKRRRNATGRSPMAVDEPDGPPRPKRLRVRSPDSQIQFLDRQQHEYVAPPYPSPPTAYLDPPEMVFSNPQRSHSVTAPPPSLNRFGQSGLFRTMSIDPPHVPAAPISREASMNLDRESMERTSSIVPISRDLSMPLPAAHSPRRLRTSLTPQPAIPREVSEPPSLSVLAQKPVFVRPPSESHHQRLSSQSSTSTLGSLVESQRRTRSPMRQHSASSLLFGSGTHEHEAASAVRQPSGPAERALHELDVYRTPLLPTRSRLRGGPSADSVARPSDPSDLFRPRRASQLLLMRDDRRASRLGRKSAEFGFLEPEKPKEREGKKVNETKPYAGEGGMKKLLARRQKEVEEEVEGDSASPPKLNESAKPIRRSEPAPIPASSPWTIPDVPPPAAKSGSSLRVGREKTRTHFVRPAARPTKKFSAAYEEEAEDPMDDAEELERQREKQELEEAAKKLPTFNVPAGFSFAKEPPPIVAEADAKEPPIASLPFSFNKPATAPLPVPTLSVDPPTPVSAPAPTPKPLESAFSFAPTTVPAPKEKAEETPKLNGSVPNFFASSKLGSQPAAPSPPSLFPSMLDAAPAAPPPLFAAPPVTTPAPSLSETPKPVTSFFPSTPAVPAPAAPFTVPTPIRDAENPLWMGDAKKEATAMSLFPPAQTEPTSAPKTESSSTSLFGNGSASLFSAPKPSPAATTATTPSTSLFGSTPTGGFSFNAPAPAAAAATISIDPPKVEEAPKAPISFGLPTPTASSAPTSASAPFSFSATTPSADAPKPFSFGGAAASTAPASNPFASSSTVSDAAKPLFTNGGFNFGQAPKEAPKPTAATSTPFSFGASTPTTSEATKPFSFGAPAAPAASTAPSFSFGNNNTDAKPASTGMFTFGASANPSRPVTPPRNEVPEFRMDESPTREPAKPILAAPSGGGGFGFGNAVSSSGSSMFGAPTSAPSITPSFSFGNQSSSQPNPFSSATTTTENKPFGSTDFGRPSSSSSVSTPFSFGQNNTATEPARPSTAPFSFGAASTPTTTTGGFGFGGAATPTSATAPANPFGSAPSSPSTFASANQPFSFGSGSSTAAPFSFGSQPASPAGGVTTLPQPATPGGFGGGPSFGAGGATGGGLFTIGAAPPPQPGQRVMKKLPRRKN